MSEDSGQRPSVRVGSSDRAKAKEALDAHLAAGRLDAGEHERRICIVEGARTRDELETLFNDLPMPHPGLSEARSLTPANQSGEEASGADVCLFFGVLVGVAGLPMTFTLWATTGQWWWVPIVVIVCSVLLVAGYLLGHRVQVQPVPVPGEPAVPNRTVKFNEMVGNLIKNGSNNEHRQNILKAAGIDSVALSQYTRGQARPTFEGLIALADFFNVSLDYLVYGKPASAPADPAVPASHVHHAATDTQAPTSHHSELMARVGRVLADRVDSVAQELARSSAGRGGLIQPDEVLRVERHCRQVDMVITGLALESPEGGLAAGQFLSVIAANLARGCQYRILLPGSPQVHDDAVTTFRQLLAEQVGIEHVRGSCAVRSSPIPVIAGIRLYLLDAEAFELAEPVLFTQFNKYMTDDHRLGYITRPNDCSNADILMGTDHIRHAMTAFETLWSTGVST